MLRSHRHSGTRRRSLHGIGLLVFAWSAGSSNAQIFDSSAADRLRIVARTYELDLSKANGAILDLRDPGVNLSLSLGSRGGCLWGANYQSPLNNFKGGCSFSPSGADVFSYKWDAAQNVLALSYISAATSALRVDATVRMTFEPDHFDMAIAVTNHTGTILSAVLFPADLVFENSSIQAAYVPYFLPGVRLKQEYFANPQNFSLVYPGAPSFVDFRVFDIGSSHLAWYVVNPSGRIAPVQWGLQNDAQTKAGTSYIYHNFEAWTADGGTFQTPVVRFRLGQSADDVAVRYKAENGISSYPSISQKLGRSFGAISAAPLVKMDMVQISRAANPSFASLASRLSLVRSPALLHFGSYWPAPVGVYSNSPDFLPPDPKYGNNQDFASLVRSAQSLGMFTMPYTNTTWWDLESPTVKNAVPASFSALRQDGTLVKETYGPVTGIVVSADAPATLMHLNAIMQQWTQDVPVDFLFNDQIGARPWLRDFNPGAPDPLHYSDAWLAFTSSYQAQRLMTEDGWDRLAETEVAFMGSDLTGTTSYNPLSVRWGAGSRANTQFGPGLWEPYPLGTYLFHDKVLLYHHNLDAHQMDSGPEVLTWNALFGVMAGYLWPEGYTPVNPDWLAIASAFQPSVIARMAGQSLTSYQQLATDVYQSRFGQIATIANWVPDRAYSADGFGIAPSGCLVRADDGSLVAGIFTGQFNGRALSAGTHYLIVENSRFLVTVRQPSGPDTDLAIDLPRFWELSAGIVARAVDSDGRVIATVPVSVAAGKAQLQYAGTVSAKAVDRYEIAPEKLGR